MYYEIVGYIEKNEETHEETEIEGLKQKLEKTYNQLKIDSDNLNKSVNQIEADAKTNYEQFVNSKDEIFSKNLASWDKKYNELQEKITSLLPNAMTAGLSSAYSSKRTEEEKEQGKLIKRFNWGIAGLIIVSIIPFAVSLREFIVENVSLEEVIVRMPKLVLAILPLYIPVMWVAYSANRKMNLSKRLIEEYSHREVLSKTFEGLSKRINEIEDSETSADLRLKLLYNVNSM